MKSPHHKPLVGSGRGFNNSTFVKPTSTDCPQVKDQTVRPLGRASNVVRPLADSLRGRGEK